MQARWSCESFRWSYSKVESVLRHGKKYEQLLYCFIVIALVKEIRIFTTHAIYPEAAAAPLAVQYFRQKNEKNFWIQFFWIQFFWIDLFFSIGFFLESELFLCSDFFLTRNFFWLGTFLFDSDGIFCFTRTEFVLTRTEFFLDSDGFFFESDFFWVGFFWIGTFILLRNILIRIGFFCRFWIWFDCFEILDNDPNGSASPGRSAAPGTPQSRRFRKRIALTLVTKILLTIASTWDA